MRLTADELGVRREARAATAKAIRDGLLVRPDRCEECGEECSPEAAHVDYAHPLDVRWLCRPCHVSFDRGQGRRTGSIQPKRDLMVPVQVYVPRWLVRWARMRAKVVGMPTSSFLRWQLIQASRTADGAGEKREADPGRSTGDRQVR